MQSKAPILFLPLVMIVVLMLTGCPATLAPNYDKALLEGLVATNTEVMEFLAAVDGGTQKDTFSQRKEKYDRLIGHFDALEIQANARPVPKNKVGEEINVLLDKRGIPSSDDSQAPSATALRKISETLLKMKQTDQKQGLSSIEVLAFKNQIAIYLDQALTYESFLER